MNGMVARFLPLGGVGARSPRPYCMSWRHCVGWDRLVTHSARNSPGLSGTLRRTRSSSAARVDRILAYNRRERGPVAEAIVTVPAFLRSSMVRGEYVLSYTYRTAMSHLPELSASFVVSARLR